MGIFSAYSLPIQGLKDGLHKYKYVLDGSFFQHFDASPIGESEIEVEVELDMRPNMIVIDFILSGWISASCDRCSADIQLPIDSDQVLFVKYSEENEEDDDEVIFISRDAPSFNLAKYLYEFSVLSLPITNVYDCESEEEPPCNTDVLQFLGNHGGSEGDDPPPDSSIWDALKNIK
ncbi:MAG: hypothetical protein RIR11_1830 [Bacteroidota bacterium]|jgi:uncharacterized protein